MLTRVAERYVHATSSRFGNHRCCGYHAALVSADAGRITRLVAEKTLNIVHSDRAVARFDQRINSFLPRGRICQAPLEILGDRVSLAEKVVGMGQISSALVAEDFR